MKREDVNAACALFAGATLEDPWGGCHDAWKIGGKMFASIGVANVGVSVKTESVEQAQFLIEMERGQKAPYFHRSWILLGPDVEDDEMRHRLDASYKLIFGKLPKKVQTALGSG